MWKQTQCPVVNFRESPYHSPSKSPSPWLSVQGLHVTNLTLSQQVYLMDLLYGGLVTRISVDGMDGFNSFRVSCPLKMTLLK